MDIGIRADGLTTRDFEDFAIELVKRRFNNDSLHGFPEGRDDGIDGIDDVKQPTLLVQAKRWQIDKHGQTAINLLKKEIDKIVETKDKYNWTSPFNYIIVTSMRLSPANLKAIRDYAEEKLPGALTSDNHIIFSSTLTTLSQDQSYKDLFAHYGLIEKNMSLVLRNDRLDAIEAESRDYFTDSDVDYFVETAFLGEAYHILQKEHILLVQGPPGIGKTTTCSMLGHLFLNNQENQIDVIVRRVEEINDVITLYNQTYRDTEDRGLLVIFDDFLGRNTFDVGERVLQDVRRLYSTSVHSNNLFICFNSRTQILKDATGKNSEFEQLIEDKFTEQRNIMIDLSSYSDFDKARIFRKTFERQYKRLDAEKRMVLSKEYDSLIGRDWMSIIQHRNYFPRIIQLIAKNFEEADGDFYDYILSNLDNPGALYDNLFSKLDDEEKYLLFSLWHFREPAIPEGWLRNAFNALNLNPTFNVGKSLEKLDGSWFRFTRQESVTKVNFLNPSIVDFLNQKQVEFPQLIEKIHQSSVYLHQLSKDLDGIIVFDLDEFHTEFFRKLLSDWDSFCDKEDFIGEKLLAVIYLDKYNEFSTEFLSLLNRFNGYLGVNNYVNGWYKVISAIYFHGNKNLKIDFIKALENRKIVYNILSTLDLEWLDNVAHSIDEIIEELIVFEEDDGVGYLTGFEDLEHYSVFRDRKIELLQDYLDSEDSVEDVGFDYNESEYKQVSKLSDRFYDEVVQQLSLEYDWKDITAVQFDYSTLEFNLGELFRKGYESWLLEDDYDSWRDEQMFRKESARESISSILDVPLS